MPVQRVGDLSYIGYLRKDGESNDTKDGTGAAIKTAVSKAGEAIARSIDRPKTAPKPLVKSETKGTVA